MGTGSNQSISLNLYFSRNFWYRFSDIAMLLGLPFLVFAWLMLIQFSFGISGRKNSNWFVFWFLLLNFSVIIIVGYLIAKTSAVKPVSLIKYYFISMNFLYSSSFFFAYSISRGKENQLFMNMTGKGLLREYLLVMILQCVPLLFYTSQPYIAVIFIFTFFAGNTFLPIYLNYGTLLTVFSTEPVKDLSFEEFCKKFEVSPRETDIVREICNGLSNKEISDKLFISLQTVKDHTHRIYIKTNVKSRVQLIYLVKELKIHVDQENFRYTITLP